MIDRQTILACLFAVTFASACGGDDPDRDALFSGASSSALGAAGNEARCATCHSVEPAAGNPGNPMQDIAFRSSFKGGGAPDLLAAVNACVTGWMRGEALTEGDDAWLDLEAYLVSISTDEVTAPNAFAPEVLADESAYESLYNGDEPGDPDAGSAKYAMACARCHDQALLVGDARAPTKASLGLLTAGRIAQQVRTSGPPPSGTADATDTTPGPMPFFEPHDLSTQDLRDIIAHVRQ